jgi:hypothetical protein
VLLDQKLVPFDFGAPVQVLRRDPVLDLEDGKGGRRIAEAQGDLLVGQLSGHVRTEAPVTFLDATGKRRYPRRPRISFVPTPSVVVELRRSPSKPSQVATGINQCIHNDGGFEVL